MLKQFFIASIVLALVMIGSALFNLFTVYAGDFSRYDNDVVYLDKPIDISKDELYDMSGKLHKYEEFNQNKVNLVMLWASWCGYCARDIPKLIETSKEYEAKGLKAIYVAIPSDTSDKVKEALKNIKSSNMLVYISKNGSVYRKLGVRGVPNYFLLDNKGYIIAKLRPKYGKSFYDFLDSITSK